MRYDAGLLGAAGRVLGGLVFTGVARTSALDDWKVTAQPPPAGTVHRAPAVVTSVFGGNAALAWEPTAGTVAYVRYSGAELSERRWPRCTALPIKVDRCLARSGIRLLFLPNSDSHVRRGMRVVTAGHVVWATDRACPESQLRS
jgi:hypothetical protein